MTETIQLPPTRATATAEISRSEIAAAATAHARLNIPLNLSVWKGLPQDVQSALTWFHQYALDKNMTREECAQALDYDQSTLWRVLNGTYEGNWSNIAKAIVSYQKLEEARGTIQRNEFVQTPITKMIWGGLDYAMANNSITLIIGESRSGKSISCAEWKKANNHGRSVFIIAPAYGGTKALLREIAKAVGVNKNLDSLSMHDAILRAFNRNRILIVDEAHRLLPNDRRTNPVMLEVLRDIHDRTDCALALIATARFDDTLHKSEYMFEQLLGRVGQPVRIPRKLTDQDVRPIVSQYLRPTKTVMEACLDIANKSGRLGILVETLKVASRMASKDRSSITEDTVLKAIKLRQQMQGEVTYSKS